jgi:hypothetical protein
MLRSFLFFSWRQRTPAEFRCRMTIMYYNLFISLPVIRNYSVYLCRNLKND